MIECKQGIIYTLCLDCCDFKDPIPCLNPDGEECDACGRVAKQVTYSDELPGQRPKRHPVPKLRARVPRPRG